jgi:hypothetical protein
MFGTSKIENYLKKFLKTSAISIQREMRTANREFTLPFLTNIAVTREKSGGLGLGRLRRGLGPVTG